MHKHPLRGLRCVLYSNILCFHRKNLRSGVMARCFNCRHYRRFERERAIEEAKVFAELEREEEEFFEEVERARRGELRRGVS